MAVLIGHLANSPVAHTRADVGITLIKNMGKLTTRQRPTKVVTDCFIEESVYTAMRKNFTDDEIIGLIAHELGHLYSEFYHAASYEVSIGDMRPIELERSADEAAKRLGFEKEIRAMRAKIPLPEERTSIVDTSVDDIRENELQ